MPKVGGLGPELPVAGPRRRRVRVGGQGLLKREALGPTKWSQGLRMAAQIRDRMEPGYVFNKFVGARRAAEACGVKDSQKAAFERNFVAVKACALDALLAAEPDTDAAALLATREQAREAEVDALIAAESCGGKEVWRLLKLHEIRSNLDLR